ncbi:LysR substrate-binding domain-containing protein [Paraburkholderia sp. C35]|uniref:LysR family transcriptional regulator n=1 Tax=Paraburkholderia sp. C35 TaxID=2126993 RepID=UPI0013A57AB4|nr:LysR substrate-binding domain-containing protein [Paraburkholderia sp. C35]
MDRSRIQVRHLRYFVKIVEAGSFSRAAALIHVAQPALSQQISELEEMLGVSLLDRSPRGARATAAGKRLYTEAVEIINRIEHLPDVVRADGAEIAGVVRVGRSSVLASILSSPVTRACKAAMPNVTLHFVSERSGPLARRVSARTLDLAIIFDSEFTAGLDRHILFRQRLFLVSKDDTVSSRDSISMKDLADLPLILPSHPHPAIAAALVDPLLKESANTTRITVENDLSATLSAVVAGLGSGILALGDLAHVEGGSSVRAIPLDPPIFMTATLITHSESDLTPAASAIYVVIRNLIARYLDDGRIAGALRADQ